MAFMIAGCHKEESERVKPEFIPTDVVVKIKGYHTIEKVFDFINSLPHEVESITSAVYTSELPADSLQAILDHLNAKPYTTDGKGFRVTGYVHYPSGAVTLFPGLYSIRNPEHQEDWLNTMEQLRLNQRTEGEGAGCIVYFHVPEGEEESWAMNFQRYEFVEWAELNYIREVNSRP